jgi:hypothetical protein
MAFVQRRDNFDSGNNNVVAAVASKKQGTRLDSGMVFQESKVLKHDEAHQVLTNHAHFHCAPGQLHYFEEKKQLERKQQSTELWNYQGRNV